MSTETTVDLLALRKPFEPELVGKLPRVTCKTCSDRDLSCDKHVKTECSVCGNWIGKHIHLDYVGHADVTIRLLEVDPEWDWQPKATDPDPDLLKSAVASGNPEIVQAVISNAPPKFDRDRSGNAVGLWIKLTVGGVTRLGVGSCPSNQNDAEKVLIGDALRNAAMRFGVAVDLWAKGDRADPTAENATAAAGQASRRSSGSADPFESATPARPKPNGSNGNGQRGQVSRPAQPAKAAAAAGATEDIDPDAQAFADEAHEALTLHAIEEIHERARKAGKVTLFVRNPTTQGLGKLAVYLDWRRKQLKEIEDALTDLTAVARDTGFPAEEIDAHVKTVTGTDLDAANVAQIRHATQQLRNMQGAPA